MSPTSAAIATTGRDTATARSSASCPRAASADPEGTSVAPGAGGGVGVGVGIGVSVGVRVGACVDARANGREATRVVDDIRIRVAAAIRLIVHEPCCGYTDQRGTAI